MIQETGGRAAGDGQGTGTWAMQSYIGPALQLGSIAWPFGVWSTYGAGADGTAGKAQRLFVGLALSSPSRILRLRLHPQVPTCYSTQYLVRTCRLCNSIQGPGAAATSCDQPYVPALGNNQLSRVSECLRMARADDSRARCLCT